MIKILHVDDSEFDRELVEGILGSSRVQIMQSKSLQEFLLLLKDNHNFTIAIIDGLFPDENNGVPKLNISKAFDAAKNFGIDIIYILSGESLEDINHELGSERKPEGIYLKGTRGNEFKVAIKSKIADLNKLYLISKK